MAVIVREATVADAAAIASLHLEVQALHAAAVPRHFKPARAESFERSDVAALLDNTFNVLLIAHMDAVPAGYAYAELVGGAETADVYRQDMLYLHHISVGSAYRRRGVGTALIGRIRAVARDLGAASLLLDVWAFNDAARAFFKRNGFALYFERPCCDA